MLSSSLALNLSLRPSFFYLYISRHHSWINGVESFAMSSPFFHTKTFSSFFSFLYHRSPAYGRRRFCVAFLFQHLSIIWGNGLLLLIPKLGRQTDRWTDTHATLGLVYIAQQFFLLYFSFSLVLHYRIKGRLVWAFARVGVSAWIARTHAFCLLIFLACLFLVGVRAERV